MRFLKLLAACFPVLILLPIHASAKPLQLGLNWKPEPQFGGFFAAEPHFKAEKLEVAVVPGGSGTPTVQMVSAGRIEYGIVSGDELLIARERGGPELVALFATYQTNPTVLLTSLEGDLKTLFSEPKNLLLWQRGLPYALYITKKWGPIRARQAPHLGGITQLQTGDPVIQQGFLTSEALLAKDLKRPLRVFKVSELGFNPYTTVLITTRTRLQSSKNEVEAVVRAVRKGWADYLKDPTATHLKIQKLNPSLSADFLKASAEAQKPLIETSKPEDLGKMEELRWRELAEQMKELGLLKALGDPSKVYLNL